MFSSGDNIPHRSNILTILKTYLLQKHTCTSSITCITLQKFTSLRTYLINQKLTSSLINLQQQSKTYLIKQKLTSSIKNLPHQSKTYLSNQKLTSAIKNLPQRSKTYPNKNVPHQKLPHQKLTSSNKITKTHPIKHLPQQERLCIDHTQVRADNNRPRIRDHGERVHPATGRHRYVVRQHSVHPLVQVHRPQPGDHVALGGLTRDGNGLVAKGGVGEDGGMVVDVRDADADRAGVAVLIPVDRPHPNKETVGNLALPIQRLPGLDTSGTCLQRQRFVFNIRGAK